MWKLGFIWAVILTLAKIPSMKTCGVENLQVGKGARRAAPSQRTPVSQTREMIALALPPLICFRWLGVKSLTDSLLRVNVRTLTRPLFASFLPVLFFLVTMIALSFSGVPQRSGWRRVDVR